MFVNLNRSTIFVNLNGGRISGLLTLTKRVEKLDE